MRAVRHLGIARAHRKVAFGEEAMINYITGLMDGCECVGLGAAVFFESFLYDSICVA